MKKITLLLLIVLALVMMLSMALPILADFGCPPTGPTGRDWVLINAAYYPEIDKNEDGLVCVTSVYASGHPVKRKLIIDNVVYKP